MWVGGWPSGRQEKAIVQNFTNNFPSSPEGSTRLHTEARTQLIPGHSRSRTHLPRGAAARCPEDVDSVPGQVPGDPKPLGSGPQGAPASSMEPLPLRWGGAGPRAVQAAWPQLHARCGRKHSGPLCQAGTTPWPAPPRWQVSPLPAGPQRSASSSSASCSWLPAPGPGPLPTGVPAATPPGCPDLEGALLRG